MKVIVGIDESDESLYALQWAVNNLFKGGVTSGESQGGETDMITLLHVNNPSKLHGVAPTAIPAGVGVSASYPSTAAVESARKSQEQVSAAVLSRALDICDNKVKAETLIVEGDAKDKLCEISEQMKVDVLVVGNRGLGKIKRAFLGSVSDYCAHHAKCPVLIVKLPEEFSTK